MRAHQRSRLLPQDSSRRITATLVVDDGSGEPLCQQSAQAFTNIPLPEKRTIVGKEFDECSGCSYDDQKARLDNLAVELQNDPTTTTYLFGYGGRTSPVGYADRLLARARDYLVRIEESTHRESFSSTVVSVRTMLLKFG